MSEITGNIRYFPDLVQGTDEWFAARRGLLTASEIKLIVSPPPKPETRVKKNGAPYKQREWNPVADNDNCRAHLYEILAQRITGFVEPSYISDDMLRGHEDEIEARDLYSCTYAPVTEMGFITNNEWGFTLGFSPDGLVGDDGFIECKSRRQRFQVQTLVEHVPEQTMPDDYALQVQTGFLVSRRAWCDFISYSGGLPMAVIRVLPDPKIMDAIVQAATAFEAKIAEKIKVYRAALDSSARLIPTERRIEQEITL